jgi:hypothetical protein
MKSKKKNEMEWDSWTFCLGIWGLALVMLIIKILSWFEKEEK